MFMVFRWRLLSEVAMLLLPLREIIVITFVIYLLLYLEYEERSCLLGAVV